MTKGQDLTVARFRYVNYKGEDEIRTVRPIRIFFSSTAYHPLPQWLLEGFDLDRQATRDFAMSGISQWGTA